MTEDAGIDRRELLAEVAGAPLPIPPMSSEAPPAPPPAELPRAGWLSYRHEFSAIVCAFVSVIWLAVGLAATAWTPCLLGAAFGVAALSIWAAEVWSGD